MVVVVVGVVTAGCAGASGGPSDLARGEPTASVPTVQSPVTPSPLPSPAAVTDPGGDDLEVAPGPRPTTQSPEPARSPEPIGPTRVTLDDGVGDQFGGASGPAPAVVDLVSVTLDVVADELVVTFRMDEMPGAARAPRVLNLVTFLDLDRDGAADDELWATLTEQGWEGSHLRRTESEAMGVQPGHAVSITPYADAVVMSVDTRLLDLPPTFDFVVASEDGLVADYRARETWRDAAPDGSRVATWPAMTS